MTAQSNLLKQQIMDAHCAFRDTLRPADHSRQIAQAGDVRAYLLTLCQLQQTASATGMGSDLLADLTANCSKLEISGALVLPTKRVLCRVDFRQSCFADEVSFADCNFDVYADFQQAEFKAAARFDNVSFAAGANFQRCVFHQSAHFFCAMADEQKLADFSWAIFTGFADFESHINPTFRFDHAQFLGGADFDG